MKEPLPENYRKYLAAIRKTVPSESIYTDPLRTLAWGTDAGFYRLTPQIVVRTDGEEQVCRLLATANDMGLPVTFRAAGTSLSGQAVSDSILLVAGKNWEKYRLLDPQAHRVALQPGIIGERVNQILAPYGRIFSPDPASKKSAMVGGIIINNASGMKCGTHANSDRVLHSVRIIMADGTLLDTDNADSRKAFAESHADMLRGIEQLRDDIRTDKELEALIRHKYSIKNVTGLNLLPFVLYDDPFDIITHVMVGSEGTLAFLSEATVNTEAHRPFTSSAMVYFEDMEEACRAVVQLKKAGCVDACELLDKKSLASVHDTTGEGLTALLIQTEAFSQEDLDMRIDSTCKILDGFKTFAPVRFSDDPAVTSKWWEIRAGVFPAVGGTRAPGTTVLIEDVAFHIEDLPEATVRLAQLIQDCGYHDACIYGHALEGNYHFVIAQSFETQADVDKYKKLMAGIEDLVVGQYKGSLKAEHGTGRNMAPFVEKEWGTAAFKAMKRLKELFDPRGILNPGVIFNDDPECYVRSIKPMPLTNRHVDRCIECGFCEVNCVSCGFTLSARQRIVVQREVSRLRATGEDPERYRALIKGFRYLGNDTCAGDGLCSTSCPMKINTGEMIHDIRESLLPPGTLGYKVGVSAAKHLSALSTGIRGVLAVADAAHAVLGDKAVSVIGRGLNKAGIPLWTPSLPAPFYPGHLLRQSQPELPRKVVYFPSCLNRMMGESREKGHATEPLADVFVRLCHKAGFEVIFPKGLENLCCGMIWESKGMPEVANAKTHELEAALALASGGGRYPVVCDQSPCLHRMRTHIKSMKLYEPAEFIHDFLAQHLEWHRGNEPVAVHVTCSSRLMGLAGKIVAVAAKCTDNVTVPAEVGCCGFAGDKGFTIPALNRWGLRKLRPAIQASGAQEGYSNSRTCEIGLTTNSGIPYKSIVYLVDRHTEKKKYQ